MPLKKKLKQLKPWISCVIASEWSVHARRIKPTDWCIQSDNTHTQITCFANCVICRPGKTTYGAAKKTTWQSWCHLNFVAQLKKLCDWFPVDSVALIVTRTLLSLNFYLFFLLQKSLLFYFSVGHRCHLSGYLQFPCLCNVNTLSHDCQAPGSG